MFNFADVSCTLGFAISWFAVEQHNTKIRHKSFIAGETKMIGAGIVYNHRIIIWSDPLQPIDNCDKLCLHLC